MNKEWVLFQGKWIEVDWYNREEGYEGTNEEQFKEENQQRQACPIIER